MIARALLLLIGLALVLFGACDRLAPRARLVSASPPPGAVLDAAPGAVTVTLSDDLANRSTISIASTITLSPSGERIHGDGERFEASGPDPGGAMRRTLRVALPAELPRGLYWVNWRAVALTGGEERNGHYCFAIGMPVPPEVTDGVPGGLREWDRDERRLRMVWAGGVLLIVLGLFLPRRGVLG